jgi:hypothetical protein
LKKKLRSSDMNGRDQQLANLIVIVLRDNIRYHNVEHTSVSGPRMEV